jgi:3,4-dihydroxy 2-butanone 4-phosphate synthase / GTP cyclohydrolase II
MSPATRVHPHAVAITTGRIIRFFYTKLRRIMEDPVAAVQRAAQAVTSGRPVVVSDDGGRGGLTFAAQFATPEVLAFTVRHTSGFLCVAMRGADLDRLDLCPMVAYPRDARRAAFAVTVDAAEGVSTGISAHDRARTAYLLADPATTAADLRRPGHVVPLRVRSHGVLAHRGNAEAAVDLMTIAGLHPAAGIGDIVGTDGDLCPASDLATFARTHDLVMVSAVEIAEYRLRRETLVEPGPFVDVSTRFGPVRMRAYTETVGGREHFALVCGEVADGREVLVRLHRECLPGDLLNSPQCACGEQFTVAAEAIAREGRGVIVYLRGGRPPHGALSALSYGSHAAGAEAGTWPRHDVRDYWSAAHALRDLGIDHIRLLTNNPDEIDVLRRCGLTVRAVPTVRPARFADAP